MIFKFHANEKYAPERVNVSVAVRGSRSYITRDVQSGISKIAEKLPTEKLKW